jgi:tetratricopeptide (TPR) repeat protein
MAVMAGRPRSRTRPDRRARAASPPRSTASPIRPSDTWWRLVVLAAAAGVTYASSLSVPFLFDDFGAIVRNPQIRDLTHLGQILLPPSDTPVAGRPLVHLTLALNYAAGGLNVLGYHVVNIGLHVLCAWLIFALLRRTLARLPATVALPVGSADLALAAALLWVVHPLTSEVVDYLNQRTESMMAAAYLLTVYASVRALEGPRARLWLAVAVGACVAGTACKETIATAPLVVVLYDRAFAFPSFGAALRARWRLYGSLVLTWAILALELLLHGQTPASTFTTAPTSVWMYLVNQTIIVPHYLRLVVWPESLVFYYGWPRPVALQTVWPAAAALAALFLATIVLYLRAPRLGFAGLWFFLTLAPTSSFVPLATEVGAERRMYLPLAGLLAVLVVGAAWLWGAWGGRAVDSRRPPRQSTALLTGAVVVLALSTTLSAMTMARTREYATPLTLAETVLARWPTPAAEYLVGTEMAAVGRHPEAIAHLERAVGGDPPARYFLGAELFKAGRLPEAIDQLQQFVRAEPRMPVVRASHVLMARAYELEHNWPQAMAECQTVLRDAPADPDAHGLLAEALVAEQHMSEAVPHYRAFLAAEPTNTRAWTSLGLALIADNRQAEAIDAFQHAADADPANAHLRENLARALLDDGQADHAASEAARAVAADGTDPAAHDVLGRALAALGRLAEARQEFERALSLNPAFAPSIEALRHLPIRPAPSPARSR